MPSKTTRKCGKCGERITIDRQSLNNIVFYQNKFYHIDCFVEKANQGMNSKRYATHWQEVLNKLSEFQVEARRRLEHYMIRDEFNDYLLANYDVCTVSEWFWNIAEDIGNGTYKRKKCKAVDMQTLMDAWKWGQEKLNKIDRKNKSFHKGPKTDAERLNYDLSIILNHIPDYEKFLAKSKAEESDKQLQKETYTKINYENLSSRTETESNSLDDISSLLDEVF